MMSLSIYAASCIVTASAKLHGSDRPDMSDYDLEHLGVLLGKGAASLTVLVVCHRLSEQKRLVGIQT